MRQGASVLGAALVALGWSGASQAALTCADVEQFLQNKAVGVKCEWHADLRSFVTNPTPPPAIKNNDSITLPNNSITTFADGSPLPGKTNGAGSFTPVTDKGVIAVAPSPSSGPAPGIQVTGWFADDPTHQARFVLRFPDDWNGKLVVAGSSGTRSEFNGDWAWSDYVVPKGYAYASQNKGVLNFYQHATPGPADNFDCRLNPDPGFNAFWVHFYDVDPDKPFTQWTDYMLKTASLAQTAAKATYNKFPRRTYAVGTSNGGYQVRRAIEEAPNLFDGGVDWEGTYIDPQNNILVDLPKAIANFPAYRKGGYKEDSVEAKAIRDAGYPPDIIGYNPDGSIRGSLWGRYWTSFWEVTACQWQKRFDPTFDTYGTGLGNYDFLARLTVPGVYVAMEAVQTTGKIKKPLVTVAGSMDALLPAVHNARAYAKAVDASRKGNNEQRNAQYRYYEVQNGNHIEDYVGTSDALNLRFTQLQLIQPHALQAFDLLVKHVEENQPLPPNQCIPNTPGSTISAKPGQPGVCAALFAP